MTSHVLEEANEFLETRDDSEKTTESESMTVLLKKEKEKKSNIPLDFYQP